MAPQGNDIFHPPEPESLAQTGLAESMVEHLILKLLYFRGDLYGQDLSDAIGLRYSVIQHLVDRLKLQHHIQVRRSMGMGDVGAMLALTESGRACARECLEQNQYAGPAPVPLAQYAEQVKRQRPKDGWLTKEALRKALRQMVVTEQLLTQIGPAVSSSNSLLVYGKPGDGKTFLIESLNNLEGNPVFLPYAIECQGNIIQVYDPVYHERLEDPLPSVMMATLERGADRRWVKCKRPFIVTGGELTLDMLDLRRNETSKVYEAPFQLKANNGIYLIDDFGRQLATPAEVLNRWIVPMERHVDFLSFVTGGKMTVPFEAFLVFSTNLNPADLGDEAFLRRIQYKMLVRGPAENEFTRIFENFCSQRRLAVPRGLVSRLIEKHYRRNGKPMRRCHPRDVLTHAFNLMHFEKLPYELNEEILDRAMESCFLQEEENTPAVESRIVAAAIPSCASYWTERLAQIPTVFGNLVFLASFRDAAGGGYRDVDSGRDYGEAETSRTLARLHVQCFQEWLALSLEQQSRDLGCYAACDGNAARLVGNLAELAGRLACSDAKARERELFANDLGLLLDAIVPGPGAVDVESNGAERLQRIA